MRFIDEIIIHCADTRPDQDISAAIIDRWHKERGFDCIGYHFFIKLDGTIEVGRNIDKVGAHCKGHNSNSIGICYAGGTVRHNDYKYYSDTRTPEQKRALYYLLIILLHSFPTITKISGHKDYAKVACPCFDVHEDYGKLIEFVRKSEY